MAETCVAGCSNEKGGKLAAGLSPKCARLQLPVNPGEMDNAFPPLRCKPSDLDMLGDAPALQRWGELCGCWNSLPSSFSTGAQHGASSHMSPWHVSTEGNDLKWVRCHQLSPGLGPPRYKYVTSKTSCRVTPPSVGVLEWHELNMAVSLWWQHTTGVTMGWGPWCGSSGADAGRNGCSITSHR